MAQRRRLPISPRALVQALGGAGAGGPAPLGTVVYLTALAVSLAWAAAVLAFAWTVDARAFFDSVWGVTALAMVAFGPCGLIYAAAFLVHQAGIMAAHDRQVLATLENMVGPAHAAGVRTAQVLDELRSGIEASTAAAERAAGVMTTLRAALSTGADRLNGAAVASVRTAEELTSTLAAQREAYDDFLARFDVRVAEIAASLVERSSALPERLAAAQTQLTGMSQDLNLASDSLGSVLDRSHAAVQSALDRLGAAGAELRGLETGLAGELEALAGRLAEQATAVGLATQQVRAEREALQWGMERIVAALSQHLEPIRTEMADIPLRLAQLSTALQAHTAALAKASPPPGPSSETEPGEGPAKALAEPARGPSRLKLFAVDPEAEPAESEWAVSATRGPPAADVATGFAPAEAAPGSDLERRLRAELSAWGIQPARVIPKRQLEEASRLVAAGQADQARRLVRTSAASVVRRLAQRAAAQPQFRADAEDYLAQFARQPPPGEDAPDAASAAGRLSSEAGRLYLLLDAALGAPG